jgi:cold shock CspA family protein
MSSHKDAVTPSEHLVGRVKWFNNKAGYGFITVTDGCRSGMDIFVHHIDINVDNQQYKYLVQGEYVQFFLDKLAESSTHEVQAMNVRGIQGGPLQCESRRQRIERRPVRDAPTTNAPAAAAPRA